jgi:4-amino-4-deoxy-L-arabinose transferase-like glycosyltransferase
VPSGEVSRFALRLPSALAAFALVAVVYAWGVSLGGFASGAVGALALLQMAQFWSLGRRGVAEMPLALFATSALFVFDRIYWGGRRALLPLFFLFVAAGFLAKATVALLLIALPIGVQLALDRSLGRALRRDVAAWAALCAVACLAWYAVVLTLVPGAWPILREAMLLPLGLVRSSSAAPHVKPFWFYLPLLVAAASPALLLAPLALTRAARSREIFDSPRRRFPLVGIASLLLAFTAIPMKQKHYLLPLLPALALALGTLVSELARRDAAPLRRWIYILATWQLAFAPAVAFALGLHLQLAGEGPAALPFAVGALVLLCGGLAFAAARRDHLRAFAAATLLASLTVIAVHEWSIRAWRDRFQTDGAARIEREADGFARAFALHPWLRRLYAGGG